MMDILDHCPSWGWEGREPGTLTKQPPEVKGDRVSPGLDTPRRMNGLQPGHGLCLVWKGNRP